MAELIKKHNKHPLDKRVVLVMLSSILYGWYAMYDIAHLNTLASLILLVVLSTLQVDQDIYVYAALIPFWLLVPRESPIRLYFFFSISIMKVLIQKGNVISRRAAIFSTIWLAIEAVLDVVYATTVDVSLFAAMIYFALYISMCRGTSDEIRKNTTLVMIFSYLIAIFFTILSSQTSLNTYLTTQNAEARFGEDARNLGGAMDVPIYCAVTIAIVIERFISNEKTSLMKKILFIFLLCGSLLFGFMTVSRSFVLGVVAIAGWTYLSLLNNRKYRRWLIRITIVFFLAVGLLYYKYNDAIQNILVKYSQREFFKSSRSSIYADCLDYLLLHPLNLLVGTGALGYHELGVKQNLGFRMFAHNLLLDSVMSWGIIGAAAMISLICAYCKGMKTLGGKPQLIRFLPFIAWGTFMMVGGTFNYIEPYLYIMILLKLAYCFGKKDTGG